MFLKHVKKCHVNVPVKSKLWKSPWAFEFLENFCSNASLTGPKSCSDAPTGKITRLLFQLFSSFYNASEAVHVNMVY